MSRQPRIKAEESEGVYHVYAHTAGLNTGLPLNYGGVRERVLSLIRYYTIGYFCRLSSFCVMGNHYHLTVHFEAPRPVRREELRRRALHFYSD